MDKIKTRFSKLIQAHQAFVGGRWRRATKETCSVCGKPYWKVTEYHTSTTCGRPECRTKARRRVRYANIRTK